MQFLLPLLCLASLFTFNIHSADRSTDREVSPARERPKRSDPSQISESPQLVEQQKEVIVIPKKSSFERKKKKPDLTIPVDICRLSSPPGSPKKSPGKNYYFLWELNLKNIPGPPTGLWVEGEANMSVVKRALGNKTIDHLFYVDDKEINNLDTECEGNLDQVLNELKITLNYIENIYACEAEIKHVDVRENTESIFVIGLSNSKKSYDLLTRLTINGHIKDAWDRKTPFNIKGKKISIDGKLLDEALRSSYKFDETIAVRIAGSLTQQALSRIFLNDESKKNGILSVKDQGELQKYCLQRLLHLWPADVQESCRIRFAL